MVKRIEWILSTKNLTPAQLADSIGIQRSSLSHILARRNKPSLDVVMKILHRYPDLETDWLLTGKGPMYKDGTRPSPSDALVSGNASATSPAGPPSVPPAGSPIVPPAGSPIVPPAGSPVVPPAGSPAMSPAGSPAAALSSPSGALDLFSDEDPFSYTRLAPSEKRDPLPSTAPQGAEWSPRTATLPETESVFPQRENAFPQNDNAFSPRDNVFPQRESSFPPRDHTFSPIENSFPGIEKTITRENENPPLFSGRDKTEDDQKEIKEIERIVFFFSDGSFRVYES